MNLHRGLVLDANILLCAAFGNRMLNILQLHEDSIAFCCPDRCVEEALRNLPAIALKRGFDADRVSSILNRVCGIIESIELAVYEEFRQPALDRIAKRDANDWPIVAVALMLQLPIWTEDQDFFGIGIPTWTTDHVEVYLRQ